MSTKLKQVDKKLKVKRYKIQYPLSAYTFPRETRIHRVQFDDKYLRVELTDGRMIAVPLSWIPRCRMRRLRNAKSTKSAATAQ